MANLFSVTIFFVVFREALEASLIVSVLLSLVDQLFHKDASPLSTVDDGTVAPVAPRVLRKLKLQVCHPSLRIYAPHSFQVFFGAFVGLAVAIAIGAAFIAIWFTQAKNLWSSSEQLWEGTHHFILPKFHSAMLGVFELVAALMIFAMGVTMLKMENARTKWRIKLQSAFNNQRKSSPPLLRPPNPLPQNTSAEQKPADGFSSFFP